MVRVSPSIMHAARFSEESSFDTEICGPISSVNLDGLASAGYDEYANIIAC